MSYCFVPPVLGPVGSTGPAGPQGAQGPTGPQGIPGPTGPSSTQARVGFSAVMSTSIDYPFPNPTQIDVADGWDTSNGNFRFNDGNFTLGPTGGVYTIPITGVYYVSASIKVVISAPASSGPLLYPVFVDLVVINFTDNAYGIGYDNVTIFNTTDGTSKVEYFSLATNQTVFLTAGSTLYMTIFASQEGRDTNNLITIIGGYPQRTTFSAILVSQ